MADKLPLFEWKPTCKILVFPLALDRKRIDRTAEVISKKSGNDADAYWRRITSTLGNRLLSAGVHADEVKAQLSSFHDAVQNRLDSQSPYPSKENKDG